MGRVGRSREALEGPMAINGAKEVISRYVGVHLHERSMRLT
jgi:hypothetical protein